jgi:hypothetical protein
MAVIYSIIEIIITNARFILGGIFACCITYSILHVYNSIHSNLKKRNKTNSRVSFNVQNRDVDLNL